MDNIPVEAAGSAVRDGHEPVRRCANPSLVRRILVFVLVSAVMSVMLISHGRAEPQQLTFPVKVGGRAGERRALVCVPGSKKIKFCLFCGIDIDTEFKEQNKV
jgi:hypothetical protein